jgi:alpha-mannosidase
MKIHTRICLLGIFVLLAEAPALAGESYPLWQIGAPDHDDRELALAPNDYGDFAKDAVFVVGKSNPKNDWPYVQPGPADGWAGSRPHTFSIVFGLKQTTASESCKLVFDLIDTHSQLPPKLLIQINSQTFKKDLPIGAGDASLEGDPAKGKPCHFEIKFSSALLKDGNNSVTITTVAGSWFLYDAVGLEVPTSFHESPVENFTLLHFVNAMQSLVKQDGNFLEPLTASVLHYGPPQEVSLQINRVETGKATITNGTQTIEALVPEVQQSTEASFSVVAGSQTLATQEITLKPVRHWVVYILMHSHTDIGYTDLQPNIERKQANNVIHALELIRQTKDYPAGSRFKWNLEAMWTADQFYRIATPEQKKEFEQNVRDGYIGVDAMYANLLTGLSRSEEMMRQISLATDLGRRCGVNVDSMMISDVPGLTWGLVPALAQQGVKYISDGPNASDRIGYVRVQYENHPFYWESPSGKERALYWGAQGGYSIGHSGAPILKTIMSLLEELDKDQYAYDLVQLRWTRGDNGPPDEAVMPAARDWNAKYAYPKLIIATTSEALHALENRYHDQLPVLRGDMTPYWEDGSGSSARETGINRHTADRLVQAETIWALRNPGRFPTGDFDSAWRKTALYSEHTWGAYNSVSQPDLPFVKEQWKYKQAYALNAAAESRVLLDRALGGNSEKAFPSVDVFNTASWPRTDLVTLPEETVGDAVRDENGKPIPSQRLSTGELAFLARDVPPFGAKRFTISSGPPLAGGKATVEGNTLSTSLLSVKLDGHAGDIVSLRSRDMDTEFANGKINNYIYLPGAKVANAQPSGPAQIAVKENGPVVVSLVAESDAPGCNHLSREVRLVDGIDRVEISDLIDKQAVRSVEGVHMGFSFNVPNPVVHINSPGAIGQPEKDQLLGACKNWFCVERWVDFSDSNLGVTWSSADAPLMEMGGLTANLPRSQPNPNVYMKTIRPAAKIYSWAMNNHWHTNYRAEQEGPTWFRYAIQLHGAYDPVAAMRFGVNSTEPLIVKPATGAAPAASRLTIEPSSVIATAFKPSNDGNALILRLYNPTTEPVTAHLTWHPQVSHVWLSNGREEQGAEALADIPVAGWDLVTLRVEP